MCERETIKYIFVFLLTWKGKGGEGVKMQSNNMIIAYYIYGWKFSNEIFHFCYYVHEIHIDKIKSFKISSIRVWEMKHTPTPQIVSGPQKKNNPS